MCRDIDKRRFAENSNSCDYSCTYLSTVGGPFPEAASCALYGERLKQNSLSSTIFYRCDRCRYTPREKEKTTSISIEVSMSRQREEHRDGEYVIFHINVSRTTGAPGDDTVCQVKRNGVEVGHCTWHPGSREPRRHENCPYRNGTHCLDR
jgi:hypothetical protein